MRRPADKGPGSGVLCVPEHNRQSAQSLPDLTALTTYSPEARTSSPLHSHMGMDQNGNSGTRRKGGQAGWTSSQSRGQAESLGPASPPHPAWVGREPPSMSLTLSFAQWVWGTGVGGTL